METPTAVFLKGKKTCLRPLTLSDVPLLTQWINDPEVRQFLLATFPMNDMGESEWIKNLYTSTSKTSRTDVTLGIADKHTGVLIGTMGIHGIDWVSRTGTTGAMIGNKTYWGKGYGTDAKIALLSYVFYALNLRKIYSRVIAFNKRSEQYSLKCGYRREAVLKKHIFKKGTYHDEIILSVYEQDFSRVMRSVKK